MSKLVSTTELLSGARRLDNAKSFFALFPAAWQSLTHEVDKLETRQSYQEPGNPSWELLAKGDLAGAIEMIPTVRKADVPLYQSLAERKVRFVRCRPVEFPLTPYLQWELGCYEFNAKHGEQIFFVEPTATRDLFEKFARHDFMVFDDRLALIHDYDATGLIQGGWELTSADGILALRELYRAILGRAEPFKEFLVRHGR